MTGKVYLVGAGPGDPELLTLKAARVLRSADVVLHDELVSQQVLQLIPGHSRIVNVGKRCGKAKISQQEINVLMISLANSGMGVARLKGGDPLIFGRLAEEIAALRQANIEFEIVPGITAALGAASSSQIPLTHRHLSHALVFLAGHSAGGSDSTDWAALASLEATLVIYMPGHHYRGIAKKLHSAGFADEMRCAIISRATTPEEQIYPTSLDHLADAPLLPAPTLLVIGSVLHDAAFNFSPEQLGSWKGYLPADSAMHTETEIPGDSNLGLENEERA